MGALLERIETGVLINIGGGGDRALRCGGTGATLNLSTHADRAQAFRIRHDGDKVPRIVRQRASSQDDRSL